MLFTYLPEEIKRLREEAELTKSRLARMARTTAQSIRYLERGERDRAQDRVLEGIALVLGVPFADVTRLAA